MDEYDNDVPGHLTWPEPVEVHDADGPLVRLTGLPQDRKQQAWSDLKTNSPALCSLLKEPTLQEVIRMFDAELFVDADLVPSLPPENLRPRRG